jgi:hypothetical protein
MNSFQQLSLDETVAHMVFLPTKNTHPIIFHFLKPKTLEKQTFIETLFQDSFQLLLPKLGLQFHATPYKAIELHTTSPQIQSKQSSVFPLPKKSFKKEECHILVVSQISQNLLKGKTSMLLLKEFIHRKNTQLSVHSPSRFNTLLIDRPIGSLEMRNQFHWIWNIDPFWVQPKLEQSIIQDCELLWKIHLQHILAQALISFEIFGFWGQAMIHNDITLSIHKSFQERSSVIWIDFQREQFFFEDRLLPLPDQLKIYSVEKHQNRSIIQLSPESLAASLTQNTPYSSPFGIPEPIRQKVFQLALSTPFFSVPAFDKIHPEREARN